MQLVPVPVAVHAVDAISRAGVESILRYRPEVRLTGAADPGAVHLMVADGADDLTLARLRRLARRTWIARTGVATGPVLVVARLQEHEVMDVVECGVAAILWRHEATGGHLARIVQAVGRGDRHLPLPTAAVCSARKADLN